jgi:cytochrome c
MRKRMMVVMMISMVLVLLNACGGGEAAVDKSPIAKTISANGDVQRGEALFAEQGCMACHNLSTEQLVGPGLAGVMTVSGPTYPNGVSYGGKLANGADRTEENIAAWIRTGGQGQIGSMSPHEMTDEQMADLLAYLHTIQR